MSNWLPLLPIFFMLLFSNSLAFSATTSIGQQVPLTISTDKSSYNSGDKIIISGTTSDLIPGVPVSILIRDPSGNLVTVSQPNVSSNKTYTTTVTSGGNLWAATGIYQIFAQYGSTSANTTFQFQSFPTGGGSMLVKNTAISVNYKSTGIKILGITAHADSSSLTVDVASPMDGQLSITLPRMLIDATTTNGTDDQFFVLLDGQESKFNQTGSTAADRTLLISVPSGTQQIEIIGTKVIPEFGLFAIIALLVSISTVVAITRKIRLR